MNPGRFGDLLLHGLDALLGKPAKVQRNDGKLVRIVGQDEPLVVSVA